MELIFITQAIWYAKMHTLLQYSYVASYGIDIHIHLRLAVMHRCVYMYTYDFCDVISVNFISSTYLNKQTLVRSHSYMYEIKAAHDTPVLFIFMTHEYYKLQQKIE